MRTEYRNHVIDIRQEESPGSRPWRPSFQTVYDIFRRAGGALLPVLAGFERGWPDQAAVAARLRDGVDAMLLGEAVRPGMRRGLGTTTNRYRSTIDSRSLAR